jgi:CRISPR-associated protein Csd1
MILQRLVEYYDRQPDLPAAGFTDGRLTAELVLRPDGRLVAAIDLREMVRGKPQPVARRLPKEPTGRSGRKAHLLSNLLWERGDYLFDLDRSGESTQERDKRRRRVRESRGAFIARVEDLEEATGPDAGWGSLRTFLAHDPEAQITAVASAELVAALAESSNVGFRLAGDQCLLFERPGIRREVAGCVSRFDDNEDSGQSLIDGTQATIARLHPRVSQGFADIGGQSSGTFLVSFNNEAFEGYGRKQGMNAPIPERDAFAYTTALSALARPGSRNAARVGVMKILYWPRADTANEGAMLDLLGIAAGEAISDDRAAVIDAVFDSLKSGRLPALDDNTGFTVLGLSAESQSRLTLRFFEEMTVADSARRLRRYFNELEIEGIDSRPSLTALITALAVRGDKDNVPALLSTELIRSALTGQRYPERVLAEAVVRSAAEAASPNKQADRPGWARRAGNRTRLIKAFLIRNRNREVGVALDPDEGNAGYRLGRLFAVLEGAQEVAVPGANATIRDRYWGSAAATPSIAFPPLLNLLTAHLGKISGDKPGLAVWFERQVAEICSGLPPKLPAKLTLDDQGAFAIGYWHQRHRPRDGRTETNQTESSKEIGS